MFGCLVADTATLTPEELERYKSCYCGLCHTLKTRFGQLSRLTLTYDMTFLVLLLESLYEPEDDTGTSNCILHPAKQHKWSRSAITDYAADMNVALAYLKCIDDWHDDTSPAALAGAGLIRSGYLEARERWPRQCAAMDRCLGKLSELERCSAGPDESSACFGKLMGELFVIYDDRWSDTLRAMGEYLGQFIYVMDACIDLDGDVFWERYNPFQSRWETIDAEHFRDILKMLLGECLRHFDRLPLVQDAGILKNILCTGVWAKFNDKFNKRKGTADVSGSL